MWKIVSTYARAGNSNIEYRSTKKNHSELDTSVIQNQPNFVVHLCQPKGHFRQPEIQNTHLVVQGRQWNLVDFELLKRGLRYLFEIFTICLSHVCANLMKKFLPLLNGPAHNGPFLPKFWTALATVFVGIFFRKKIWWGFRPISVAYQKEFCISWKKRRFQIFQKPPSPGFQSFLHSHVVNQTCFKIFKHVV